VKKLGIAVGALVVLILMAIVIVPLVVDVDKYRPQIVDAANQQLNGKLELGHLKLSLWGQVRVEIDGLALQDAQGAGVVSVKNAYFHIPFLPLITGSPVIDLMMDTPSVNVVKYKTGKMNVTTLMKTSAKPADADAAAKAQTQAAPAKSSEPVAIPAIATRARIGFDLKNAFVQYKDETSGLVTDMKDLNIELKDLSLSHPGHIAIWSDFDTKMGKTLTVKGPGRIDLDVSPHVADGKIENVALSGKADFDDLEITMPGTFEKKKGVLANVELAISGSEKEVKIEKMDANFFNVQIKSSGTISNLDSAPTVKYAVKSNEIELKSWVELLPMLKEYELGGSANLSAEVSGPTSKIAYQAKVGVVGLTAKAPKLKTQPRFDGEVTVATDQIQSILLTMQAPGNELQVKGSIHSFTSPQATFDITSSGMDLDQLIDFPPPAQGGTAAAAPAPGGDSAQPAAAGGKAAPADYDAMLEPIRQNKMLANTTANIAFNLKMLKVKNAKMTDMVGKLYFKDLAAGLEGFSMKIFNGGIKMNMSAQLRPKAPTYKFSTDVAALDMGEAVKSQMAAFKDTVTGKANFNMTGEGVSFNPDPAMQNLKAKGSMKITNAQFTTIDVGKMVTEAIGSSLQKISSKVPSLSGKNVVPSSGSKYDWISSNFGISGGTFSAPDFATKATPNQGIDLKGATTLGLKDLSIKANWQVIDTYDVTKAKEMANGLLVEKGKPFTVPVGVGCTLKAPCYSYGDAAQYLGKIAANNMIGNVKSNLQDQLKNAVKGGGAPNIGNALKGLFGH
jgi:uncharacterized protein involved in outer membrane biogenesis